MKNRVAWVAGEALIDLIPELNGLRESVGGGAANTARALVNLEIPTKFIGGISSDKYGKLIRSELERVDLTLALKSDLPTAVARVHLDSVGSASYEFNLEGTATFDFRRNWLPQCGPDVLHIGTLATIIEPGANELFEWAKNLKVPLVFDPNVRLNVLSDKDKYRKAIEKWVKICTIVKFSEEDMSLLEYNDVEHFFKLGAKLIVVTRGASGIDGYYKESKVSVPGVKVNVKDTVGAGDTVGAILVEALLKNELDRLVDNRLREVLHRGAKAAAITCSRIGALPPTREELKKICT